MCDIYIINGMEQSDKPYPENPKSFLLWSCLLFIWNQLLLGKKTVAMLQISSELKHSGPSKRITGSWLSFSLDLHFPVLNSCLLEVCWSDYCSSIQHQKHHIALHSWNTMWWKLSEVSGLYLWHIWQVHQQMWTWCFLDGFLRKQIMFSMPTWKPYYEPFIFN